MSAARSCSPGGYWIVVSSIAFRANMYAAQYAEDQCVHGKAYLGLQLTSMYDPGSIQLPWDNPRPRTRSGYHKDVQLLRYVCSDMVVAVPLCMHIQAHSVPLPLQIWRSSYRRRPAARLAETPAMQSASDWTGCCACPM